MSEDPFLIERDDAIAGGDETLDDIGQRIDGDGVEHLLACRRVRAGAAAHVHGDGVDDFAVDLRAMTAEPDVSGLMVSAPSRTAGPVHRHRRCRRAEAGVELLRQSERRAFGVDEGEVAEVGADPGDEPQTGSERRCAGVPSGTLGCCRCRASGPFCARQSDATKAYKETQRKEVPEPVTTLRRSGRRHLEQIACSRVEDCL